MCGSLIAVNSRGYLQPRRQHVQRVMDGPRNAELKIENLQSTPRSITAVSQGHVCCAAGQLLHDAVLRPGAIGQEDPIAWILQAAERENFIRQRAACWQCIRLQQGLDSYTRCKYLIAI